MNIELLRKYFTLDPETGFIYWQKRDLPGSWNARFAGKRAGSDKGNGYRMVSVEKIFYLEHRVIFAIANGVDPGEKQVDHINGIRSDNRPCNLQLVTNTNNVRKRHRLNRNNKSGVAGVEWHKSSSKWAAGVKVSGRKIYLGLFASLDDAATARKLAEEKYFGEFKPRITERRKAA